MVSKHPKVSQRQARSLALRAQGLWEPIGRPEPGNPVHALTRRLGAVQLDTISTLARSHELVAYARLGAIGKSTVEDGYWRAERGRATHFEYWSHAASILPIESWPLFGFRRQAARARGWRWHEVDQSACGRVLAQLQKEGPLTTGDMGGARRSEGWWNWSDAKIAVEYLLDVGDVIVSQRDKWRRVYDLPERVLPARLHHDADTSTALRQLLDNSLSTLGIGTRKDILDVHRLNGGRELKSDLESAWNGFLDNVVQVTVAGSDEPHFATAAALESLDRSTAKRNVALSPFDSLVWYRPRLERFFGMEYRIEAYTPAAKRTYGYFAMPVLVGDEIVARIDPKRTRTHLTINRVSFEGAPTDRHIAGIAAAIADAASWVGCDTISIADVSPKPAAKPLRQLAER